jgi:hypothetical protein
VVLLCGLQFFQRQRENSESSAALVIHEMHHSLGLGENPPSSKEITARVMRGARSERRAADRRTPRSIRGDHSLGIELLEARLGPLVYSAAERRGRAQPKAFVSAGRIGRPSRRASSAFLRSGVEIFEATRPR